MSDTTTIGLGGKPYNWHLLGILVVAMFVSTILVTPYALAIQGDTLKNIKLPLPLALLMPIQWVAGTLFCGILAAVGLVVARRIGLGLPFLEGWLARKPDWSPRFVGLVDCKHCGGRVVRFGTSARLHLGGGAD